MDAQRQNLVRAVAANLQRYRARVLTHEGAQPGDAHVETENAWGPRVRGDTPLGRRIGLFSRLIDSRETAIVHLFWPHGYFGRQFGACSVQDAQYSGVAYTCAGAAHNRRHSPGARRLAGGLFDPRNPSAAAGRRHSQHALGARGH